MQLVTSAAGSGQGELAGEGPGGGEGAGAGEGAATSVHAVAAAKRYFAQLGRAEAQLVVLVDAHIPSSPSIRCRRNRGSRAPEIRD